MFNNKEFPSKIQEVVDGGQRGAAAAGGVPAGQVEKPLPLSYPHIGAVRGAFLVFHRNSSFLKSCKGGECEAVGGGPRGNIKGFSPAARYRLLCTIAKVRRDAELPNFILLTYPAKFPSVERAKRDLRVLQWRMEDKFSDAGWIWKLEPQDRGAPHYHLLHWGVETGTLLQWVVENWFEIAGDGDLNHKNFHLGLLHDSKPCVAKVKSFRGVWFYAAKYIGKTFEVAGWGNQWIGRFWGVRHPENIPFGAEQQIEMNEAEVVQLMRYQRRFMHRKGVSTRSMTTFCEAEQWVDRLVEKEV